MIGQFSSHHASIPASPSQTPVARHEPGAGGDVVVVGWGAWVGGALVGSGVSGAGVGASVGMGAPSPVMAISAQL